MRTLGTIDLEMLHLAISGGGRVDESSLERSPLKRLGVGRILDALASLRDRGMLTINEDGSFSMTDASRRILWDEEVPLWARILRLLEIRSCSPSEILSLLNMRRQDMLSGELDGLARRGLVLFAPRIRDGRLEGIYEVLPDGIARLEAAEESGIFDAHLPGVPDALGIIDEISHMVGRSQSINPEEKHVISGKLSGLRDLIEAQTDSDLRPRMPGRDAREAAACNRGGSDTPLS